MSQSKDQIEQDAIAAEWGLALDPDAANALAAAPTTGGAGPGVETTAAQWSAVPSEDSKFSQNSGKGGTERVLSQEEIDSLLVQRHLIHDAHHCPHGRPTALSLSRMELDRQFGRLG